MATVPTSSDPEPMIVRVASKVDARLRSAVMFAVAAAVVTFAPQPESLVGAVAVTLLAFYRR